MRPHSPCMPAMRITVCVKSCNFLAMQGIFPHVPPVEPMGNWDTSFGISWWKDKKYFVRGDVAAWEWEGQAP